MRTIQYATLIFIFSGSLVFAADNTKQIETAIRNYRDAVAKADDIRSRALNKERNETLAQLSKLATRAFADKDRVSETRAWKAILTLDRSHGKAVQYFKDLGTLQSVLEELPDEPGLDQKKAVKIVGRWHVFRDNQAKTPFCEYIFQSDGHVLTKRRNSPPEPWAKFTLEDDSIVTRGTNSGISRFTILGDRFLQEQWDEGFPASPPNWFYFGMRAK